MKWPWNRKRDMELERITLIFEKNAAYDEAKDYELLNETAERTADALRRLELIRAEATLIARTGHG